MKALRKRKWQWHDPLYCIHYYLYTGDYENFAYWVNGLKGDDFLDPSCDAAGQTVWFHLDNKSSVAFFLGDQTNMKDPTHLNTVVHEALHAVFAVMQSRGLRQTNKSEEAFTYYLGWVVEEMVKRLMK